MEQTSNKVVGIVVMMIFLTLYSLRNTSVKKIDNEDKSVSLCQVRVQFDEFNSFDDQTLLSLLAALKMHDFQIRQAVWTPSNILLYLCEHRLHTGLKQSIVDKELNNVINNNGVPSKYFTWSCA